MSITLKNGTTPVIDVGGIREPLMFNHEAIYFSEILSALKEYISSSDCCEKYRLFIDTILHSCALTNGWNSPHDGTEKYDYFHKRIDMPLDIDNHFPKNTKQKPLLFRKFSISGADAAKLIHYVLTNTDLINDDPRIGFISSFNKNFARICYTEKMLFQKNTCNS